MEILKTVLMIIFAIDCIALSAIVLLQEGSNQQGSEQSAVWQILIGDRTKDVLWKAALVKSTKFLAILFIVLAAVLNLKVFA